MQLWYIAESLFDDLHGKGSNVPSIQKLFEFDLPVRKTGLVHWMHDNSKPTSRNKYSKIFCCNSSPNENTYWFEWTIQTILEYFRWFSNAFS